MKAGIVLFFALLIGGCMNMHARGPDALKDTLKPGDGAVIMHLIPDSELATGYVVRQWDIALVERLDTQGKVVKSYSLSSLESATTFSTIFAASLPPGKYQFSRITSGLCNYICGGLDLTLRVPLVFEVKSGQLTDLGTVVQVFVEKNDLLVYDRSLDGSFAEEVVRELLPAFVPLLKNPVVSAPKAEDYIYDAFKWSKSHSYGFAGVRQVDDNTYIYGSANGVVFTWSPGEEPVPHDLGVSASVEALLDMPSGTWLAGGELGLLVQSSDRGKSWTSIRGNLPFAAVVGLGVWKDEIIVTLSRDDDVLVYRAKESQMDWKLIATFKINSTAMTDVKGVYPGAYVFKDDLIVSLPGSRVAILDLNGLQAKIHDTPGSIRYFSVSDDGVVRCRCMPYGLEILPYESSDFGKTWRRSTISEAAMIPLFGSGRSGFSFREKGMDTRAMIYTSDGGATWRDSAKLLVSMGQIFLSRDKKEMYAGSWSTRYIIKSTDGGKQWTVVRAPRKR